MEKRSQEFLAGVRFALENAARLADPLDNVPHTAEAHIVQSTRSKIAEDIRGLLVEIEKQFSSMN